MSWYEKHSTITHPYILTKCNTFYIMIYILRISLSKIPYIVHCTLCNHIDVCDPSRFLCYDFVLSSDTCSHCHITNHQISQITIPHDCIGNQPFLSLIKVLHKTSLAWFHFSMLNLETTFHIYACYLTHNSTHWHQMKPFVSIATIFCIGHESPILLARVDIVLCMPANQVKTVFLHFKQAMATYFR